MEAVLRSGLIIPVGIFVLGALALIWSLAATTGGKRAVGPRYTKDVIDDSAVHDLRSNAQDGRMTEAATTTVGAVLEIDGFSETTKLAEAVADTVSAYGDDSIEYFFSVLGRQGVEPPEIAASNPEWADKSWNLSRLLIAGADIDDKAIRVEPVKLGEGYLASRLIRIDSAEQQRFCEEFSFRVSERNARAGGCGYARLFSSPRRRSLRRRMCHAIYI